MTERSPVPPTSTFVVKLKCWMAYKAVVEIV